VVVNRLIQRRSVSKTHAPLAVQTGLKCHGIIVWLVALYYCPTRFHYVGVSEELHRLYRLCLHPGDGDPMLGHRLPCRNPVLSDGC